MSADEPVTRLFNVEVTIDPLYVLVHATSAEEAADKAREDLIATCPPSRVTLAVREVPTL